MTPLNHVKILLGILVTVLTIYGLSAFSYNFRKKKFVYSPFLLFYSCGVIMVFSYIYAQQIMNGISTNQFDLRNAEKLYYYLNVISAVVSFLSTLILSKTTLNFLNNLRLFTIVSYFQNDYSVLISTIWLISLKFIAIPILLETTLIMRQMHIHNETEKHLLATLLEILPWIISNTIPSFFFAILILNKQLMLALDNDLENIAKEVNYLQTKLQIKLQKPYYRMQRFCDLSDKVDELAIKYTQIEDGALRCVDILTAPFLCSLVCNLFGITAGLFSHYHAIADTLINDEDYDIFNAITSSVFMIIPITEIILQAHYSNESLMVAKKAGYILQRMNLLNVDIRFKQSVEEFSLLILTKKFKIQPWGLLEINVSLMHDVLSAVTTFLLILIQSDLALRFSLK